VKRSGEQWKENRRQRLALAGKALLQWSKLRTAEPFQRWAERRYSGLTQRFLTRAINNEELPEPRKKGH
jgi:hypothetical protein